MHEILAGLHDGARLLDLGSGPGSFPAPPACTTIRFDLKIPGAPCHNFVQVRYDF